MYEKSAPGLEKHPQNYDFCNLQKTAQSKQPPNRRKLDHSGHPVFNSLGYLSIASYYSAGVVGLSPACMFNTWVIQNQIFYYLCRKRHYHNNCKAKIFIALANRLSRPSGKIDRKSY
jgi:hypothetical protein